MAQEQPGLNGGRHNSALNFRVDDALLAGVTAFAESNGVSRSEACRLLLAASLGEEPKQALVREAIFRFSLVRRRFIGKLMDSLTASVPQALAEAEAEASEEAAAS